MVKPSRRGPMVEHLASTYQVGERHSCRVLCVARATYRYRSHLDPRTELRMRIREIAQSRVRYGYRKIRALLNREGWNVGKYLVCRLYKEEGLTLKKMRPQRKRKAIRHREERFRATGPDQAWSIDFVADQLQDGRRFRALTVVDTFTREAVAIEAGQSLKGDDVVRTLNRSKNKRGVPNVCSIPRPGNCCANTCARSAAGIASKKRTTPSEHRCALPNCCGERAAPGRTSARSAMPSIASKARSECAASWAFSPWPRSTAAAVDEACAAALDMGVQEYRFVRRYLERCPQAPLSLQQVDPLIRELVQYRDFINYKTKEIEE
jgi:transposase